jgi:stage II sporulation protein D
MIELKGKQISFTSRPGMPRRRKARRLVELSFRCALLTSLFYSAPVVRAQQEPQEIRFGVLGLFHPRELVLEQSGGQVISIVRGEHAGASTLVLDGEPGRRQVVFRVEADRVIAGDKSATSWAAAARNGGSVALRLSVPAKVHRLYWGRITIRAHNDELEAVVSIDRETAVASIVSAEMDESTPVEALKAQAVATRSFLAAGARHTDFDFCDSTHCQFLKSPPRSNSRVCNAVQATRGLIIQYRGRPLAAQYSSRCGGHTRSLSDVHLHPGDGYPYYSVPCLWCRQHPFVWRSRIGSSGHAPGSDDETRRIAEARQWGWSAIPSSDFTATQDGSGWQLEGHSVGHGIGMCQHGAAGMANSGAGFREILDHYYPNTTLALEP